MAVSMRAGLVHRAPIATTTRRAALPRVRAGPSDQPPSSPSTSAPEVLDAEARIEALEASSRKAARRRGGAGGGAPGPRRSIPIRGQQPSKQQEQQLVDDQRAAWKEGSLLPEGAAVVDACAWRRICMHACMAVLASCEGIPSRNGRRSA